MSRVLNVFLRYLLLFAGLSLMSLGIAVSIRSDLGTTPISSVPYTLNLITGLSVGMLMIITNLIFVSIQILILRRRFPPIQLLQIPVVMVFGFLNDVGLWLVRDVTYSNYLQQWLLVILGIVIVGVGVALQVKAKATPLAGEGLVLTLSNELIARFGTRKPLVFGNMKVQFDIALVVIAAVLGLIFLGNLGGVREGTVAAALFVGPVAQLTLRALRSRKPADNIEVIEETGNDDVAETETAAADTSAESADDDSPRPRHAVDLDHELTLSRAVDPDRDRTDDHTLASDHGTN